MPPAVDVQSEAARDAAATKRLKKREIDRRCQREARQRTKSRIAYLESLVDELRCKDSSGQVASLMQQVAEVRRERDMFARTLRGIEDSIKSHHSLLDGVPPKQEPTSPRSIELNDRSNCAPNNLVTKLGITSFAPTAPWSVADTKFHPSFCAVGEPDNGVEHTIVMPEGIQLDTPVWAVSPDLAISYGPQPPSALLPNEPGNCECCEPLSPEEVTESTAVDIQEKSIWRFAHTVLDRPPVLGPKVLRWEDENSDDVPVRAIAEGWSAVEARLGGHLPPIWRKLRRIDEVVFGQIGRVERLAILRVMHWLMRYHADPASQRATIPPWYLARPSQHMAHAYALDFFTWPGLRERFMFSQHAYCSNAFWRVHNAHLNLLWQYDFRDCYTVNRHTGTYQLSDAFEERIADINAWTMKSDFFKRWPELYGDIPSFECIAVPMDNISSPRAVRFGKRALQAPPITVVEDLEDEEPVSPPLHGLGSGLKEGRQGNQDLLYAFPPAVGQAPVFAETVEGGCGDDPDIYLNEPEDGPLSMLPEQPSRVWDVNSSDTLPEYDWLWLTSGFGSELQDLA